MPSQTAKALSKQYCPRFGMLAVEMGFVTVEQVREAMGEQIDDDFASRPHRLLGDILIEKGWITQPEVETVLKELLTLQKEWGGA